MIHAKMLDIKKGVDVRVPGDAITVLIELHMLIWAIFDITFKNNADCALDALPDAVRHSRDSAKNIRIVQEIEDLLKNNKFGGNNT